MEQKTKKKILTCLIVSGVIAILLVGFYLIVYQFNYQKDECVSSPLVFGAKQYTDRFGFEFYGFGTFEFPQNTESIVINFNSTSLAINPNQ